MAIHDEDLTLHLPRILCLHGGGTNARIFRMQCRVLERMLRPHFRLVYAEAPLPAWRPGPDVTAVYKDYGPFKAWLRVRAEDPIEDARDIVGKIEDTLTAARIADDYRGATGEWVGLLGFSQGAHLAASILATQQELQRTGDGAVWPEYRFAVLLAGRGPLRWLYPDSPMPQGFVDAGQCTTGGPGEQPIMVDSLQGPRLLLPTVHVHGLADPGIELHRRLLYQYCDGRVATLVEWGGSHRVPIKLKDVTPVVDQILSVARRTGVFNGVGRPTDYLAKGHRKESRSTIIQIDVL
jgi:pimeloyl-ACP methyl ester carboxylesterase